MKYTNNLGLSNAVAKAIIAFSSDYDKVGWKSVTTLIDSPRAQLLRERHDDEIVEDVSELIWSFFGNMGHLIAERHAGQDVIAEQRFVHTILGKEISLKPDRLEKDIGAVPITWTLRDFKVTSVWILKKAFKKEVKQEWERQMNMYACLLEILGFPISGIKLEIIGRDWRMSESRQSYDYPKTQACVLDVPIWTKEKQMAYMVERINLFKRCEGLPDNELPKCTADERWADPDRFAVVKKKSAKSKASGYKSAVQGGASFKSNSEAMAFIQKIRTPKIASKNPKPETVEKATKEAEKKADELEVEFRRGESKRCERGYCKAAPWCNQFREEIKPAF